MVETDSLSFILSCCSIPFYISGLIGNVLVIRIVHKTREMHTPTNYLLASMAVSDVFTILMFAALKFAFSQHVLDENFGHLVCKASALSTTFITIFAIVCNGNRTEWSPIRSVIIRVIKQIGRPRSGSPICLITSMITDRIGRHEVLLPINHNFNKICDI